MSATLPAKKFELSGRIVAIIGAVVAITFFFLPWIGLGEASLTGKTIGAGPVVAMPDGTIVYQGSWTSYLVPLTALVVLGLVVFTFWRGHVTEGDGFVAMGLSLFTLLILWVQFGQAQRAAADVAVNLQFQYGLIGTYLALIAMFVAGGLNIRAVSARKPELWSTLGAWGFMVPAGVLVTVFFFVPVIILLGLSLTDLASSNFGDPLTFIGLENYARMFSDRLLPKIMGNTVFYVVMTLGFFNVGLALVLALLTTHVNRRAGFFFRVIWLLPRLTPSVIYILMWQRITANAPFGIINQLLTPLGVEERQWLFESPWLFVILVNGFVGASFGMILFASAIESIPKDYITAAKVDGASDLQIIRDITLPLIRWPLLFVTVYQTLSLLTSFEYILLLTDGGPGLYRTEVWALTAYHRALQTYFGNNQWGYGAAWGFILVIIGIVLSIIYLRLFRFDELVQEPKIDVL
jgi:inositol-phosphate transport system permease protein